MGKGEEELEEWGEKEEEKGERLEQGVREEEGEGEREEGEGGEGGKPCRGFYYAVQPTLRAAHASLQVRPPRVAEVHLAFLLIPTALE